MNYNCPIWWMQFLQLPLWIHYTIGLVVVYGLVSAAILSIVGRSKP